MRLLLATWLAAHVVDVAFTAWAVSVVKIAYELNPIGYGNHWLAWPIKISCILFTPIICRVIGGREGRWAMIAGVASYVLLAARNGLIIALWLLWQGEPSSGVYFSPGP